MRIQFDVGGMTCAACSARVEKVAAAVTGVQKAEVNLLRGTLTVYAEDVFVIEPVICAVEQAGYTAQESENKKNSVANNDDPMKKMFVRLILSSVFLAILMYFTMGHMLGLPLPSWYHGVENAVVAALVQLLLTLPVVYLNRSYYIKGFNALWHSSPNMDSLIAVGSAASLIYGIAALFRMAWSMGHGVWETVQEYSQNLYFESAAMILTLITVGKYLEARAKGKTGDAIRQLMDLSPKTATVRRDGSDITIPVEEVKIGDEIVIRSGDRIPVDGTVLEGRGSVDQSALTGESVPVEKEPGTFVAAATVNKEGYFIFRADKVGEDTTLSQVIRMVEEAGGSKAPIARLADKIAGIFVPVVMSLSVLTFIIWMIAGMGLEFSLNTAISVLVISCPCALGLATPVAIMVGTGRGASLGVLYKNAETLENLHKVDTVVLDKTGTLTQGKPEVVNVLPGSMDAQNLLQLAASLEVKSEHPFAKAIVRRYGDGVLLNSSQFKTLPGHGVAAIIEGVQVYGGNRTLMEQLSVSVPDLSEYSSQGATPLYFADGNGTYLGAILAADVLKDDSAAAVNALTRLGLRVIMLTGDNQATAEAIATSAGISHVIADVLPADKAAAVQKLQNAGHHVLMVGDGINDAPALVTADVGMAIGAGTDIAVESADVVLMGNSLSSVYGAVELSRSTMKNIKENLFWAFFYNSLGIPIAAGVLYPAFGLLLSPMLAAAAMSMSSVFVVSNALRLRFFHPRCDDVCTCVQEENMIQEETIMEKVIKVEGMMCPHCKARVEAVCAAVSGVQSAVVDLQAKQVALTGNPDMEVVKKAIHDAGYEVIG